VVLKYRTPTMVQPGEKNRFYEITIIRIMDLNVLITHLIKP